MEKPTAWIKKNFGIGLTGSAGTGKTTVGKFLSQELGFWVVDADQLSREVTKPGQHCLAQLVQALGTEILAADGSLNRGGLREKIFDDSQVRKTVEGIIHPQIQARLNQLIAEHVWPNNEPTLWFYEAALIFETGIEKQFREVWCTHCEEELQYKRLMARPGHTAELVRNIMKTQSSQQVKCQKSDRVIYTGGSMEEMKATVGMFLQALNQPCAC